LKTWRNLFLGLLILTSSVAGFWWWTRPAEQAVLPPLLAVGTSAEGFARALTPREFVFPLDHGPHLDFQTEWWYYTGNLEAGDPGDPGDRGDRGDRGARYGYQLTIFRRGLTPGATPGDGLRTNQIYFAHFAITDVARGTHRAAERFSRGAGGLAGAQGEPTFAVWLEDWRIEALNADGSAVRLRAQEAGLSLDLELRSAKPVVLQGERGLSPKSSAPGNASYYVSYTRLATTGTLTLDDQTVAVRGESWFDHEWSTSALGPQGQGWDWFSLQLSDGRELMLFQIRNADGSLDPVSGGTLIAADGTTTRLLADDVVLEPLETWTSPRSGATYPIAWRVVIAGHGLDLTVRARIPAQEMPFAFTYWEGTVAVTGTANGQTVMGFGYLEMTGYLGSMQGVF